MNALAMMTTTANVSLRPDCQISAEQLRQILTTGQCLPACLAALSIALTESPLPVIAAAFRQHRLHPQTVLAFDSMIGGYPPALKAWLVEQLDGLSAEAS